MNAETYCCKAPNKYDSPQPHHIWSNHDILDLFYSLIRNKYSKESILTFRFIRESIDPLPFSYFHFMKTLKFYSNLGCSCHLPTANPASSFYSLTS